MTNRRSMNRFIFTLLLSCSMVLAADAEVEKGKDIVIENESFRLTLGSKRRVYTTQGDLELVPCSRITNVAGNNGEIRVFLFNRKGRWYVSYWHISGEKRINNLSFASFSGWH